MEELDKESKCDTVLLFPLLRRISREVDVFNFGGSYKIARVADCVPLVSA